MAKYSAKNKVSQATQDEAMKIARGTQKPGQTKEQTKLIAQGIQKGIDQYKKQQKAKSRELDKKLKKTTAKLHESTEPAVEVKEVVLYKQHWLPWLLLVLSWIGFGTYLFIISEGI
ncbi:DUF2956 domain-containing protein [Endozoicomonas sp. SM1973]|uniref:DUF2956 domain-containing protein n=1 Tax=Spartinivicinus marinus TaxID=2994442 RepID=A0A853I469_9GAMM|nr:DUF2956 domain-containing protein [Spartinivicinus marinus]MCX4029314.1 DUF2956 domain-containing protein [Spartinivicinus marinus]NYZ68153.1 DUF2956 domain-containing protein [Spartinivicinus marinus]